jgi:hypothetical protein
VTVLKPIVALVPEEAETLLIPIVDQIAASIRTGCENDLKALLTMRMNGWTFEMLAYGRLLAAAVECGVVIQEGQ